MALQCDICYDKFTSKLRRPIKCEYEDCKANICFQCFKRFLIMEGSEQECMACKQPISTGFIFMHATKAFRDEYVNKVVEMDLIKERALLKATQERLDARIRSKILKSRITALSTHLKRCGNDDEMVELLSESTKELRKLDTDILEKSDEEINNVSTSFYCPLNMCRGLVKNGRCGACKKTICAKCREERLEEHECNKDLLETFKFLKRDTKPCPKCKTLIHKIDGCDQMFCIKCKTAFSWRTLSIQRGLIHNPHYYEYMAQLNGTMRGIQIGVNDPCGEELDKALKAMFKNNKAYIKAFMRNSTTRAIEGSNFMPRVLNEVNAILPVLTNDVYDDETIRQNKQTLRETYLTKRPNGAERAEANWITQMRLRYKSREMKKDLIKIIEVFDRGLKDFIIMAHNEQDYDNMFDNITNLINFFRKQLAENETRHNLKNKTTISIDHGLQCRLITY